MSDLEKRTQEKKLAWVVWLAAVLVAAAAVLLWWRMQHQQQAPAPVPAAEVPAKVEQQVKAPVVIDLDQLDKNERIKAMLNERKETYGLKNGLDAIVRPEESIRLGGETISIQDIVDKIRLHKGQIVEQDVTGYDEQQRALTTRRNRMAQLEMAERRVRELETLQKEGSEKNADELAVQRQELAHLKPIVEAYQRLVKNQHEREQLLEMVKSGDDQQQNKARKALKDLQAQRQELEQLLQIPPIPKRVRNELGLYIVQPGDNIWNIHFRFLKDFFLQRGVELSPLADEPGKFGMSSGVGKILKFSETLVYIYNIRERKIDMDLNLIYPKNKLVVYQMEQVFNLLESIDLQNVNRIQFDGENIWIPPDQ